MKVIAIVIASFWLGSAAMAQGTMAPAGDTPSVAAGKKCQDAKLHGAALTSHVKSCCEKAVARKPGWAPDSYTKPRSTTGRFLQEGLS